MKETSLLQPVGRLLQDPRAENVVYTIAVAFLVFSLWLPPFSAGTRILHFDYPVVTAAGGVVSALDGAQLLIPEGALDKQLRLKMTVLSVLDFLSGTGDKAEDAAAEALSTKACEITQIVIAGRVT